MNHEYSTRPLSLAEQFDRGLLRPAHGVDVSLEAIVPKRNIKAVFDELCVDLKIDNQFCRQIRSFAQYFITKNSDHINFFGTGLLGVYPLRWTSEDRSRWLDDILEVDESALEQEIHSLPHIRTDWVRASDVVNNSFVYVLHRLDNATTLDPKLRTETQIDVISIMLAKFLSSLMAHYFPYPADESIARATYASLSLKSDIKRLGSWGALLRSRATDTLVPKSLHRETIREMQNDDRVQYMIQDMQSRIKDVVKTYSIAFHQVKDSDGRAVTTSSILELEDGITIKDVRRAFTAFSRYIHSVVPDKTNFVRTELVDVVMSTVSTASPSVFSQVLEYLSINYADTRMKWIREFVDETILYSFGFISDQKIAPNDLVAVLKRLHSMFTGSRINNAAILKLREIGDKIVTNASPRGKVPPAPERTALLLYIVLRTLTMQHYK